MDTAPQPRQIDSWRAAEENAADWMRCWGFPDATVTPGGPDAGIDVRASGALAQVKWEAAQTGAPALQRLVGARRIDHHKALLFFSGAGYSTPAVEYADDMDIALFKYALNGSMAPVSLAAHRVTLRHERESRFPEQPPVHLLPGPPRSGVAAQPYKQPGRGWLGRNWTAVLGVFFLLQALINGVDFIQGDADSGIDWYDPILSLVVGLVFTAIWGASSDKRKRWKSLRQGTAVAPTPTAFKSKR